MAPLITQDYRLEKNSLLHGQFLVECYRSYPGIIFTDVSWAYPTEYNFVYICINVPSEIAMLLKLRFGSSLCSRPKSSKYGDDTYDDDTFKLTTSEKYIFYNYESRIKIKNYIDKFKKNYTITE